MLNNRNNFSNRLSAIGNTYGQVYYAALFAGAAYTMGLFTHGQWVRGTGIILFQTLVSAGVLNLAIKSLAGRSRPYLNRGNYDFHFWAWKEEFFSLPSGHTVVAFSLASVLAARIKNTWVTIALYGLAGVTAWSRLYSDDHWFSDVVIGGVFTSAMGNSLVRWYEGERGLQSSLQIVPTPRGVTVSLKL